MTTEEYWAKFIKDKNLGEDTVFGGEYMFSNDENDCIFLTSLILSGKKTAQTSALPAYHIDNEPLPKKGAFYILTDWQGNPVAVLQTKNVYILPFIEVTWDMAQKEGQDADLSSWRERYQEFFTDDADIMGYDFSETMPVVIEEFNLVYKD